MNNIMKELSQMKHQHQVQTQPQDKANIDIGIFKKKIKKE